mmetsp:Transcript_25284/g.19042  ORF Transcript_25284/g.19042 Transcript_25284/m.19042 type:complete len:106 (+) Transcript_25284:476-793(+)
MEDGIILCKLIDSCQEGTIDFRAVNMKKLNVYMIKENLNLGLNAARGIGIKIPGITNAAFLEKKHHLILAVLWQIMRRQVTKSIDLVNVPELIRLVQEGEELKHL